MVVDDSVDSAESMALLLGLDGYDVRTANDGLTAVGLAREFAPEAVVLDIGLPGMDGYAVALALRELESCRNALIIALTGYARTSGPANVVNALPAGFDAYLTKPADPVALGQLIAARRAG